MSSEEWLLLKAADDERHEKYSLSQCFSKLPEVQVSHLSAVPNKTQKGLNHSTFQMRKFLATAPEPTVEISSSTFTACLSRVTDLPQSSPLFPSQSLCGQGRTGPTDLIEQLESREPSVSAIDRGAAATSLSLWD